MVTNCNFCMLLFLMYYLYLQIKLDGKKISFKDLRKVNGGSSPDPNAREVCICPSGELVLAAVSSNCNISC